MTLRIAVVTALACGTLGVLATPALAVDGDFSVSASSVSMQVGGGSRTLTVAVTLREGGPTVAAVEIEIPEIEGVEVAGVSEGCNRGGSRVRCNLGIFNPGQTKRPFVRLQPPRQSNLQPGQDVTQPGEAVLDAPEDQNPGNDTASFNVKLAAQALVSRVSGTITDGTTREPVPNAEVAVKDSAGHQQSTATDNDGKFSVSSSSERPIAPGTITITVTKDGYESRPRTFNARAGQSLSVRITLTAAAATPSATPTESAAPTAEETAVADQTNANDSSGSDSGGMMSWILIGLGALLVIGGIVAITLLFARRRDPTDDGTEAGMPLGGPMGPGGPPPMPIGAQGVYRGAGGAAAQPTMVTPPYRPEMDQPTMVHDRPLVDPVDPYDPYADRRYDAGPPTRQYAPEQPTYGQERQPEPSYDQTRSYDPYRPPAPAPMPPRSPSGPERRPLDWLDD